MRAVLDPNQMRVLANLVGQPAFGPPDPPSNASATPSGPISAAASSRLPAAAGPISAAAGRLLGAFASSRRMSMSANGLACGPLSAAANRRLSASASGLPRMSASCLALPGPMGAVDGLLGASAGSLPTSSGSMLPASSWDSWGAMQASSSGDVMATVTFGCAGETNARMPFRSSEVCFSVTAQLGPGGWRWILKSLQLGTLACLAGQKGPPVGHTPLQVGPCCGRPTLSMQLPPHITPPVPH